jgi:glucose/arabinose dehydrogenase
MSLVNRWITAFLALCLSSGIAAQPYKLEVWTSDLNLPWSITFLPDGSALVTELGGELHRIDSSGQAGPAIKNLPEVYFAGQGGLFDVLAHPRFEQNGIVYLSFAEGSRKNN